MLIHDLASLKLLFLMMKLPRLGSDYSTVVEDYARLDKDHSRRDEDHFRHGKFNFKLELST